MGDGRSRLPPRGTVFLTLGRFSDARQVKCNRLILAISLALVNQHGYIGNDSGTEPPYEDAEFEDAEDPSHPSPFSSQGEGTLWSPHLELPAHFPNLSSGYTSVPEFTNYAIDFAESLDYVLLSGVSSTEPYGLSSLTCAPVLKSRDMKQYVAMPNQSMPSDHISLVCDAVWSRFDGQEVHDTRFPSSAC
jgi:hypothetical protein